MPENTQGNERELTPEMENRKRHVMAILSEQRRHQIRLTRKRMTWWIPLIFVIGLCVGVLGLIPSITAFLEKRSLTFTLFVLAFFTVFFACAVVRWLAWPFPIRPRIVPYFNRVLEGCGGKTMTAFWRGRGLYREIVALEQLAGVLGVKPLSAFGFRDDYYEQEVHWHAASEGLRTVETLRQGLGRHLLAAPDLVHDLEALASVTRVAADQGVDFSLVLRLHASDSLQIIMSRETRQGSFW
jgi:hypothetical protein